MGDVINLEQPKNKLFSTAVWMQQLKRVIEHAEMDGDDRLDLLKTADSIAEQVATAISKLPDIVELDCPLSEIENVAYVNSEQEANLVMSQALGVAPKNGDMIH